MFNLDMKRCVLSRLVRRMGISGRFLCKLSHFFTKYDVKLIREPAAASRRNRSAGFRRHGSPRALRVVAGINLKYTGGVERTRIPVLHLQINLAPHFNC